MNTIHKVIFHDGPGPQTLKFPQGGRFLSAQNQNGYLAMWIFVNTDNEDTEHNFFLLETGNEYPVGYTYLATVQLMNGAYVLHILEEWPNG